MANAIIIHGSCEKEEYFSDKFPSLSNSHWLPWLQKQLLINGNHTQTPEMPDAYPGHYEYEGWSKHLSQYLINSNTVLIGFSMGGGFLLRWLTENEIILNKLILVAPWMDPSKRETDNFFEFEIDSNLQNRISETHVFVSIDDDTEGIKGSWQLIRCNLPNAVFHEYKDKGHFTETDLGGRKFPDLLKVILDE